MTNVVKEIHHEWLTLPDGTKLAYRAWMPEDAETNRVPTILEFLPYRKNDGTVIRDEITMPETAEHGYACIRVDLRGCGESEGLFDDEYSAQELQDACDVIGWIRQQPWSDGNVGMVGISWGGFNSLQVAALNPPGLKAIITICSTDDRYRDDIHFSGGCLLNDNMDWAAFFWAYAQARAPDAKLVGENWKQVWLERLDKMPFLALPWITEQTRSKYWKHASVCEDYSNIKIPVYAIGGWSDGYRNTVFSLLSHLSTPKKGLVGPWAHKYPNIAFPAPKIDYVKESVRWWDRWLKGYQNGIDQEPELNYFLQESVAPQTDYEERLGQWVSETSWPSPNTKKITYHFAKNRLIASSEPSEFLALLSPQSTGLDGGRFCAGIRLDMEQPADQRMDDAGSLTFDSDVLEAPLAIAGQVLTKLTLASDTAEANVIVRISDVHPNGAVTKITHGILNLTHRNSHEFPEYLDPHHFYEVNVALNYIAYVIPKGHRIRIAISTSYWPLIWPSSEKATLTFNPALCRVEIPTNPSPNISKLVPKYEREVSFNGKVLKAPESKRVVSKDYKTNLVSLETFENFGRQYFQSSDSEIEFSIAQTFSIHPDDPLSAVNHIALNVDMGREDWKTGLNAEYRMTCDKDYFYITAQWQALHDQQVIFEKTFNEKIQRNFM